MGGNTGLCSPPMEASDKPTLAFFGLGLGPQLGRLYSCYSVNWVLAKSAVRSECKGLEHLNDRDDVNFIIFFSSSIL